MYIILKENIKKRKIEDDQGSVDQVKKAKKSENLLCSTEVQTENMLIEEGQQEICSKKEGKINTEVEKLSNAIHNWLGRDVEEMVESGHHFCEDEKKHGVCVL